MWDTRIITQHQAKKTTRSQHQGLAGVWSLVSAPKQRYQKATSHSSLIQEHNSFAYIEKLDPSSNWHRKP